MKKITISIAALVFLGISISPGYSAIVSLYPTDDIYTSSGLPDSNTDNNYLYVGTISGNQYVSFLKFDLSSIPDNSVITSADLVLRSISSDSGILNIDRVQTNSNVTNTTSWNNPPAIDGTIGSLQSITGSAFYTFALETSGLSTDLLDNAFSLRIATTSGFANFLSSNYDQVNNPTLYDPKLTITYQPVPVPGAVWLLGSGIFGLVTIRRKLK